MAPAGDGLFKTYSRGNRGSVAVGGVVVSRTVSWSATRASVTAEGAVLEFIADEGAASSADVLDLCQLRVLHHTSSRVSRV